MVRKVSVHALIEYLDLQVCTEYVSFDRLMGMCLCKTDDLEEICNPECRIAQRYSVSFKCSEPPLEPHVILRDSNSTIVVIKLKLLQIKKKLKSKVSSYSF